MAEATTGNNIAGINQGTGIEYLHLSLMLER